MRINVATLISLLRTAIAFLAVYLITSPKYIFAAGILIAIAVVLDAVDGYIARQFGFEGKIGELSDLYADHIVANAVWVTFACLSFVSIWIPLITTTRDIVVDWFRQAGFYNTGLNGFEQVNKSKLGWLMSSRPMRFLYATLKLLSWSVILWSVAFTKSFSPSSINILVSFTVFICLLRAIPSIQLNWRSVLLSKKSSLR